MGANRRKRYTITGMRTDVVDWHVMSKPGISSVFWTLLLVTSP